MFLPACRLPLSASAVLLAAVLICPPLAAQSTPGTAFLIEDVRLESVGPGRQELLIHCSADLDLIGVRATESGLVVQLPRHVPGPGVGDLNPSDGLINAVRINVEKTARGPLTRMTVTANQPIEHAVSSEDSVLRLKLWRQGLPSEEDELRRQLDDLRASLAASEQTRAELAGRVESLRSENQQLAERFEGLESRRRELDGSLKATLSEVTGMLRGMSARTEELNEELRQAEGRENELREQVTRLESTLSESEGAKTDLDQRLQLMAEERDALTRIVAESAAKTEELTSRLSTIEEERDALSQRVEDRDTDSAQMSSQLEALTAERDALQAQVVASEQREQELQARLDAAENERQTLRQQVSEGRERESQLTTRLESEQAERQALAQRMETGSADDNELLARLNATAEERDQLARDLAASTQRERELQATLSAAASREQELRDQLAELGEALAEVQVPDVDDRVPSVELGPESSPEVTRIADEARGIAGRTLEAVRLREGPGTEFKSLELVAENTIVEVNDLGPTWHEVRLESGLSGWIHGEYLELESSAASNLMTALAEARAEIDRIRTGAESSEAELEARLSNLEADKESLGERVRELEAARRELETTLASSRQQVALLEETSGDSSQLSERIADLETARRDLEDKLEASQSEIDRLRAEGVVRAQTTAWLNLRVGPSLTDARRRVLEPGAIVQLLTRGGEWVRIRSEYGEGWVFGQYLSLEDDRIAELETQLEASQEEAQQVREQAVAAGAELRSRLDDGGSGDEYEPAEGEEAPSEVTLVLDRDAAQRGNARTREAVNLYEGPSKNFRAIGLLWAGERVEVVEEQDGWSRVQAAGSSGWVPAEMLEMAGSASASN